MPDFDRPEEQRRQLAAWLLSQTELAGMEEEG